MRPLSPSPLASWIWDGAEFIPATGLPLTDRGVRYGMSVFESIAIRAGRVEFLTEHLLRLESTCRRLEWPVDCRAYDKVRKVLEGYGEGPVFARIYQTAGDGGPLDGVTDPRLFIFAEHRSLDLPQAYTVKSLWDRHLPLYDGFKTANYWPNLKGLAEARAAGFDEGLLFNPEGELISACMANVFVMHDGVLKTPPAGVGARRGVIREWVVHHCSVEGSPITRDDLEHVTECFLTSSWFGVLPVSNVNGRVLETKVAEGLRHAFFEAHS